MSGESSYDKVYQRIFATKQCKDLLAGIPRRIEEIHVVDVSFALQRPEEIGKPAVATPQFKVKGPDGEFNTTNGQIYLELGGILSESKLRPLISEVFGVPGGVPTYFCRKGVVDGSDYRKGTASFSSWLVHRLGSTHDAAIATAKTRVLEQVRDWQASEHVAKKQREFLVANAVADIKKSLASYQHLGQDVLKSALRSSWFTTFSNSSPDATGTTAT
jgi:hypothetical protein